MGSIRYIIDLCKSAKFLVGTAVLLVGMGSFGLGRYATMQNMKAEVGVFVPAESPENERFLVASKYGNKYFYPWCGGVGSISKENRVWFSSVEEARSAGYEPAGNCKGL